MEAAGGRGSSFIVRVRDDGRQLRILVHDLRSNEVHEFATWPAFQRFAQSLRPEGRLK